MQTYVSTSYAVIGEKHVEMCLHKQSKLLKVLLNGLGRMGSPRESEWSIETIVLFFTGRWDRAFPGTKLVFLCINCGYGLFIRLFSP